MTQHVLEYVNKDGEVVVAHFNETGITESFVSQGQRGEWEDPSIKELFISRVGEEYFENDLKGQWFTKVGVIESAEIPAYELIETFKEEDWKQINELANGVNR